MKVGEAEGEQINEEKVTDEQVSDENHFLQESFNKEITVFGPVLVLNKCWCEGLKQ